MSALDALIDIIRDLRDRVRLLEQQETPFEAGILPPTAGGTGVDNGAATFTLAASIAMSGSGAASGKVLRHDGSRFVPATLAVADLPAHASTHGAAGSDPVALAGSQITSGTVPPARLGSGTPSASTLLFGDGTWATLAAADIPNLDAAKITTGTMTPARLGSGSASSSTYLRGDSTWATLAFGDTYTSGSTVNGEVAYFNGSKTISGDTGLYYDPAANVLTSSGGISTGGQTWTLGSYTATVSSIVGYLTVSVNGTTRKIAVVS